MVRVNSAGWTTGADKVITDAFVAIRETLGGMTGDTLAGVPPTVTESTPLWAANLLEYFESAPLQWYAGVFDLGTAELPGSPPMFKGAFDTAMNGIANLASYKAPRRLFVLASLGRGPNGKLDHQRLREIAIERVSA